MPGSAGALLFAYIAGISTPYRPRPMRRKLLLYSALLLLTQCSKCKNDPNPADPAGQLPPATQTGANTFGCLVDGKVWTPYGNNSYSNYTVSYDPNYRKGTLNVSAYRYVDKGANDYQTIGFFSDSLRRVGSYPLTILGHQEAVFIDNVTGCKFQSRDIYYRRGILTITRLDQQAGIVSGTFWFTLYKPGCDSVRVTNGRFDKKL